MGVETRVGKWVEELIKDKQPIELVSFFEELPIKVKVKPISLEEKFIHWESHPRLRLAVNEFGRVYTTFLDPEYGKRRILAADVTYHNDSIIETTKFKPYDEPRFNREFPRVTISPKLPVKLYVLDESNPERVYQVKDLSEYGIGFVTPKGAFKLNQKLKTKVELPYGSFQSDAEVKSLEPLENRQEKVGIKFLNLHNRFRNLLHRYVMNRQREILDTIKLLSE